MLLCVIVLLIVPAGFHGLQVALQVRHAARLATAAWADAQVALGGPHGADALGRLQAELPATRAALADADTGLRHDPALWLAARLPWLGPQVRAAEAYTGAGAALSDAAVRASAAWNTASGADQPSAADPPPLQTLAAATGRDPGDFLRIQHDLDRASAQLAAAGAAPAPLLAHVLPAGVQALPARAPDLAVLATLAGKAPALLGVDAPARYLVLGMDETELYPAGGLIGSYAQLNVENGVPQAPRFSPASSIGYPWMDGSGHFTPPPAPLAAQLLAGDSWDLATSGWSPNFAASAAQADQFVQYYTGHQDDVVAGIDLVAFQALVDAVGGVTAPQYGAALKPGDPPERMDEEVLGSPHAVSDPNVIGGALAEDLYQRLAALPATQWPELLQEIARLAPGRHIQLYARDPALEQAIVTAGLDGGMGDTAHDYLAVVDANTRSTKLNLTLQQQIDLKLTLNDDGSTDAALTLTYKNDVSAWAAGKNPDMVKALMCYGLCRPGTVGGLYGEYLRVYLPAGSSIAKLTTGPLDVRVDQSREFPGLADFGAALLIPQGNQLVVTLTYHTRRGLLPCATGRCYTLYLRKQAGTADLPVTVSWRRRSGGAAPSSVRLNGAAKPAGSSISISLDRDQDLQLSYAVG